MNIFYAHADVVVVGGGIAGLAAAHAAALSGAKVLLMEQDASLGGRAPVDGVEVDGQPAQDWIDTTAKALESMPNVRIRTRMMGAGVYDHGYIIGYERLTDHAPEISGPRHRLWAHSGKTDHHRHGCHRTPAVFCGAMTCRA